MWMPPLTALAAPALIVVAAEPPQSAPVAPATPAVAAASAAPFASAAELVSWVTAYYLDPEPDRLGQALEATVTLADQLDPDSDELIPDNATMFQIALAHAIRNHPDRLETWTKPLFGTPRGEWAAGLVGWWIDTPEGDTILQRAADRARAPYRTHFAWLLDRPTTNMVTEPIETPFALYLLWSCFFMTGNTDYIARFVPFLPKPPEDDQTPGWQQRLMLHGVARSSFTANAYQHPRVLDFARAHHADTEDQRQRAALAEIIQAVEQRIEQYGPPPPLNAKPEPAAIPPTHRPTPDADADP